MVHFMVQIILSCHPLLSTKHFVIFRLFVAAIAKHYSTSCLPGFQEQIIEVISWPLDSSIRATLHDLLELYTSIYLKGNLFYVEFETL